MAICTSACSEPYIPGNLYQATTPDCAHWLDGSRFELPGQISVFASKPAASSADGVQLGLAYFVPKNGRASFVGQQFLLTVPHGSAFAEGKLVSVKLSPSPVRAETTADLPSLPSTLQGDPTNEETMYQVNIEFQGPIPERFDFTPPRMVVGAREYAVRTYTYRFFKERNEFGLCS